MTKLEEVMQRLGSRPAAIYMACMDDSYGDTTPYRIEGRTAIINVTGPLSNAAWSWSGTTYGDVQRQLDMAACDPNVKGALLNVNSPGGDTDMMFETGQAISQFSAKKPIYAVSATKCYSAAAYLATQCDQVFCTAISGGIGSIGVYAVHMDISGMLAQSGAKPTIISAGKGKAANLNIMPLTPAAKATMQASIDRLYGQMTAGVASGRKMSADAVVALGAAIYDGADAAVASGLADKAGDMTDAWSALEDLYDEDDVAVNQGRQSSLMERARARKTSVASATKLAAQAAINLEEKSTMADDKKPADDRAGVVTELKVGTIQGTLAAPAKTEAEIQEMVNKAVAVALENKVQADREITDLCAIAGNAQAAEFIASGAKPADVRKVLVDARAAASKAEGALLLIKPVAGADAKTGERTPNTDVDPEIAAMGTALDWSDVGSLHGGKNNKKGKV